MDVYTLVYFWYIAMCVCGNLFYYFGLSGWWWHFDAIYRVDKGFGMFIILSSKFYDCGISSLVVPGKTIVARGVIFYQRS